MRVTLLGLLAAVVAVTIAAAVAAALIWGDGVAIPGLGRRGDEKVSDEQAAQYRAAAAEAAAKEAAAPRAVALREPSAAGWLTVAVTGVELAEPRFWDDGGEPVARGGECLLVTVKMRVTDLTKRYAHRHWGAGLLAADYRAVDQAGEPYTIEYAGDRNLVGRAFAPVVAPAAPAEDLIVLRAPSPGAEYIDLTLDVEQVGKGEKLRFRIPAAAWKKPAAVSTPATKK